MKKIRNLFATAGLRQELANRRTKLYRIAYSWCHNSAQADDLVQETIVKALNRIDSLRDHATLDTWLYRIMMNTWHDQLRVKGRSVEYDEMSDDNQPRQIDSYQEQQIVERVRAAIAGLPVPLREVVTLADFTGCSYAQIAEIVDVPIGTVMSRLFRARSKLKDKLLDLTSEECLPVRLKRVK